jgi:hypothetical protein
MPAGMGAVTGNNGRPAADRVGLATGESMVDQGLADNQLTDIPLL